MDFGSLFDSAAGLLNGGGGGGGGEAAGTAVGGPVGGALGALTDLAANATMTAPASLESANTNNMGGFTPPPWMGGTMVPGSPSLAGNGVNLSAGLDQQTILLMGAGVLLVALVMVRGRK